MRGRLGRWASSGIFGIILRWFLFEFATFWYQTYGRGSTRKKVAVKKPAKKWILRGLKLRGLTWNHINTPYFIHSIEQRKKLSVLGGFENQTPTHIDATHAFSKILQNFQNRIPREFNRSLYISRIGINHWISSNFLN